MILTLAESGHTVSDPAESLAILGSIGIEYEEWPLHPSLAAGATSEQILAAYSKEIDQWKLREGYTTADVIDVHPDSPGLDTLLAKFSREHWHAEDEVRFVLEGHGLFHIHPTSGPVVSLELFPGDLIRVPKGTLHWFDLCADRRIRAIRLFQDPSGWTPHYSESGLDSQYQPLCFDSRHHDLPA
jgi:1,2-dihydroxy-3-keto-5-methylthiopentene dioxygenase